MLCKLLLSEVIINRLGFTRATSADLLKFQSENPSRSPPVHSWPRQANPLYTEFSEYKPPGAPRIDMRRHFVELGNLHRQRSCALKFIFLILISPSDRPVRVL